MSDNKESHKPNKPSSDNAEESSLTYSDFSIVDLSVADLAIAGFSTRGLSESDDLASSSSNSKSNYENLEDKIIVTVGNNMMGDDGAGPLLAQKMRDNPIDGWSVIDGGTIPEDSLHILRRRKPKMVMIIDAAEMAEKAGTIKVIDSDAIADMFIMSTHSLPLNFLLDELKAFIPNVLFIGIQPAIVAFSFPMTEMVENGVEAIYQAVSEIKELDDPLPSTWFG